MTFVIPLLIAVATPAPTAPATSTEATPVTEATEATPPPTEATSAPAPATIEAPAAAEPAEAPAAAPAAERHKLLLLDFRDDGVGEGAVRVIHDSLASHLSRDARLEVLSSEDVRRAIDFEAQKIALGCSDEACLAEIAGALGARMLLHGTAGKLGELVVVNVSLYDAAAQRSVGKETIEADKIETLLPKLRDAGDRLIAPLVGPADEPNVLLWSGIGVGGVGLAVTVIAGVVSAISAQAVTDKPSFTEKKEAAGTRDVALVVAGAGAAGALAGVALAGASLVE